MSGQRSGQGDGGGPAPAATVLVTRARHPLAGHQLRVLGRMRRHGRLELLVVLPDGSKSLLPAAWTDQDSSPAAASATASDAASDAAGKGAGAATLGSLADLAHAATLVAALLAGVGVQREQAAHVLIAAQIAQRAGADPCLHYRAAP